MERAQLHEKLSVSQLIYGMWRLTEDEDTSPAHTRAKIETCLEQGITTMDQADIYGDYTAEDILGQALRDSPGLREQIEIITKCDIVAPVGRYADKRVKYYDTSAQHITASVETSLRAMHTDHIDLLLLHRPDPLMDAAETGAALDALVQSGKVLTVGVSNFKPHDWTLLQSAMSAPLVTNQIEISLLAPEAMTNGDLAHMQTVGARPMAWSALGGGSLFNGDNMALWSVMSRIAKAQEVAVAAVALAWLLRHPAGILPVIGSNKLSRLKSLSDAFKVELDRETWFELYSAAIGKEVD